MAKLQTNKVGAMEQISPVQRFIRSNMTQLVTLGVLLLLSFSMTFLNENFLTPTNIINVFLQASVIAILAIGMSFVIFSDGIDLSVGSVLALCCTLLGDFTVNKDMNAAVAIIVVLLIGAVCGFLNGLLITQLKMPAFIVTMGALRLWSGVALEWVDGVGIYSVVDGVGWLGKGYLFDTIPYAVILMIALFAIAWFILRKTSFGLHVYALGDNESASKLSGIKANKVRMIIYTISGVCCGIASVVTCGRMSGSTPTVGSGYELEAIAGVAIGGASMSGGVGSIWGTFIGVIMVQVIRNGMNMMALSSYYQQIIIGLIIIFAVGIDCFRRRKVS